MSWTDKIAIVTGASSGIGRATARALAAAGVSVVAVARRPEPLREACLEIERLGGRAQVLEADVTDATAPERIVAAALEIFGGIDVLVNAAGIIAFGGVQDTADEAWDEMMDVNLRAPFRLLRTAAPHLIARRGTVVNVSSVTGLRAFPGLLSYSVAKAAVDQLTRCAALDLAPHGVRVNAVNPGVVVTNLHRSGGMAAEPYAAFLDRSRTTHPLGRAGNPDEVAALILFLASEQSGWITGETIAIDGGRHLTCAR